MMRRIFLALLIALLATGAARAYDYYTFEQITVANSAIGFTTANITLQNTHPQAKVVICRLETAEIRYRYDGTAPTSSVGTLLEVGDWIMFTDPVAIAQFKAIRTGATSGVLDCNYAG